MDNFNEIYKNKLNIYIYIFNNILYLFIINYIIIFFKIIVYLFH